MLLKTVFILASATLAAATPVRREGVTCTSTRPVPTLPVNGGAKELPTPVAGTSLKAVLLGFGIQNYTCSESGATPVAAGALAMLYDITKFYPGQSKSSLSIEAFNKLGPDAHWNMQVPLNRVGLGADSVAPFPADAPLNLFGLSLPFSGHHFFNINGVPEFRAGDFDLVAKKLDQTDAPAGADRGPDNTGAVAWLYLGDAGGSLNAKAVYRVITTGGASHGCSAAGTDSTSYTAQYWVYN